MRDDLRAYVVEHLGDAASGVLIVDETGFLKKGDKSCGVGTQYSRRRGRDGQRPGGRLPGLRLGAGRGLPRPRPLPARGRGRTTPRAGRKRGCPAAVRFATKPALAQAACWRGPSPPACRRGWVAGDTVYGRSHAFRRWLEARGRAYVLAVPLTHAVALEGRRQTAAKWAAALPGAAWRPRSAGTGVQGARVDDWACLPLDGGDGAGVAHWLLVRRWGADPDDVAFYVAYGPASTSVEELVRVCGMRWEVEVGFAQAKGEVGLDQYEVRPWTAWHRLITLALLAHAYLAVTRLAASRDEAAE